MKVNYDDFIAERNTLIQNLPLSQRNPKRGSKRRPRDEEERKVLFRMIQRKVEKTFESGEWEYIDKYTIRWH